MRPLLFIAVGMLFYYLLPVVGIVGDDLATLRVGLQTGQRLAGAYQNPQLHAFALVALALLGVWALRSHRRTGVPIPSENR